MSSITDLGIDFDDLEVLLNKFLADGLPCNEDLTQKRQQLDTATQDTGTAAQQTTTTLAEIDSALVDLRQRAGAEVARFNDSAQAAQSALGQASNTLDTALQTCLQQMTASATENQRVAVAVATEEAGVVHGFANHKTSLTQAADGLLMISAASTRAHQEGLKSVQDQARLISEHGQQTSQQMGQFHQGLSNYATQLVPGQFGLLNKWVQEKLQTFRGESLNQAGQEVATALSEFQKSVGSDVSSVGQIMNKSFSAIAKSLQHGQESLSQRSLTQTQTLFTTLTTDQQLTSLNFEPGLNNAIHCSDKFAKLRQNLDKILNSVNHR